MFFDRSTFQTLNKYKKGNNNHQATKPPTDFHHPLTKDAIWKKAGTENNTEQEEGGGKAELQFKDVGERTREAESRTAEKLKNFVFTRSQRGSDGFQKFLKISKVIMR